MKTKSRRRYFGRAFSSTTRRLFAERLEERAMLSGTDALMHYQIRVVQPGGALFMPDPQNPQALVPTADLTSVNVGDSYDLVLTAQATDPAAKGVFAGYMDISYDSSKTQVVVPEFEEIHFSNATGGTFTLNFGGHITDPIAYSATGIVKYTAASSHTRPLVTAPWMV